MFREFRQASRMSGEWGHLGQTLIWAVWVLAAATEGPAADAPVRSTRLGWVRGKQATVLGSTMPVNVFLGIPFAAPPLGPLRFKRPKPALLWNDSRDATSYPKLCLQNSVWLLSDQHFLKVHYPNLEVSEDCLYLNIYAPAHANTGSKLPVLSPMASGLFHKAIMESGVAIIPFLRAPDDERNEDLQVIARICGCNVSDSVALLQCLRAKSSEELLDINKKTKSFTRVVDGFFFPDEPLDLLTEKTFNSIPSVIGVNNHECGFLLPMKEFPEILGGSNKSLALHLIHRVLHIPNQYLYLVADQYFYNKHSPVEIRDSFLDLLGDVFFVVPGVVTARYHRDAGAPVYFYEFQHPPECLKDTRPAFVKADHSDEIRFVFGGAFLKGNIVMFEGATEEEKLLSRKMMRYWANFARTGDPNGEGLPLWPAYSQSEQYLKLDLNISVGQKLKEQEVEFWSDTLPLIMSMSTAPPGPPVPLLSLSVLLPFLFSSAP
ncbi:carboxylesterase 5A isoform X2 [Canis lupus baileyi]|uniref:carboxylesterase 5A isoform X2 n=1 Tax=Canis lupus dingo TaxID=286419 RepID=UPI000BAA1F3B|nr:carboxylesterase 5A isoform X2 [Canis lupus dingo]|eukprot:XP_022261157.1 carboxylesterase 5A isoform X1 [Canis lupus familiaris]